MTVNCFYLFSRNGVCLCYREWHRTKPISDQVEHFKLMFGMLFELKNFCGKLSSQDIDAPKYYVTASYALHYLDTPTGLRLVLLTSPDFGSADIPRALRRVFVECYLEYAIKNPMYRPGQPITNENFMASLDHLIKELPCF